MTTAEPGIMNTMAGPMAATIVGRGGGWQERWLRRWMARAVGTTMAGRSGGCDDGGDDGCDDGRPREDRGGVLWVEYSIIFISICIQG